MLFSHARMFRRIVRQRLAEAVREAPPDVAMNEMASAIARALAASPAGANWFSRRMAVLFLSRQILREADAGRGTRRQHLRPANDAHA